MSTADLVGSQLDAETALERSAAQVAALLQPHNVVILGASDRPGSWAIRLRRNLMRYGFAGQIYAVNPKRTEIWDGPCYPDVASLPEPPDHLAVLVPAADVPQGLRRGAAAGARSATIYTAGFDEMHDEAALALGRDLAAAIAETGLGVSGPNCFGNLAVGSRLVTFMADRQLPFLPGPLALVGQSGGVIMFTNQALEERGLLASYVVTSGNEVGLGVADYIGYMADQPEVRVILCYTEAIRDVARLRAACAKAHHAGKHVVMFKLGQSEAGKAAAMAHTGALAGSVDVFDAVAGAFGVVRVGSLDEAIEACEYLVHNAPPMGKRVAALTLSGAYRGILLDAAARTSLSFPALAPETTSQLQTLLSVGSTIGNPMDGGFAVVTNPQTYMACIAALDADPNTDLLLIQAEIPREPGDPRAEKYVALVEEFAKTARKPIALISMATHSQSDYSRQLRAACPHISLQQEANKALSVLDKIACTAERVRLAAIAAPLVVAPTAPAIDEARAQARRATGPVVLDEPRSKAILSAYGIVLPRERLVTRRDAVAGVAREIGFPLVMKAASANLPHKSDAGAVLLGIASEDAATDGWDRITANLTAYGFAGTLDGMLVAEQVSGGLELVLGLHRDPEMGLVVMVGAGGVLLELVRDVAFAAPPITREKARDMLERTRVGRLLRGYRGRNYDEEAVIAALIVLGRIATDLGDMIESVDVNPFVAREQGGVALDALFVLRPHAE